MTQPTMDGMQKFEVKDVMRWIHEEAMFNGELGLSCNFPDQRKLMKQIVTQQAEPENTKYDLQTYLSAQAEQDCQLHEEFARRRHLMEGTLKPLVARTEREMTARLMKHGRSKRDLAGKSLKQLFVDLTNLSRPPVDNFIEVWVNVGPTTGLKEMFQVGCCLPLYVSSLLIRKKINLPLKASLAEVRGLLNEAVDRAVTKDGGRIEKGGLWKYQLITTDMKSVINSSSKYLRSDIDYRELIKAVKGTDGKLATAVLTQVSRLWRRDRNEKLNRVQEKIPGGNSPSKPAHPGSSPINKPGTMSALCLRGGKGDDPAGEEPTWNDAPIDEPLDEDGNPYFGPSDPETMKRVAVKYAETHKGMMD